jgi:hypothetical protein
LVSVAATVQVPLAEELEDDELAEELDAELLLDDDAEPPAVALMEVPDEPPPQAASKAVELRNPSARRREGESPDSIRSIRLPVSLWAGSDECAVCPGDGMVCAPEIRTPGRLSFHN